VEDGDADDPGGDDVGVGARHAADQAVEAKPMQVVADLRCRVVSAEESGHQPANALVGEGGDSVDDEAERPGQGHGALIPEAQASGSLALPVVGLVDALQERRADGTTLAGSLDHKRTVVDLTGLVHKLVKVLDAGEDAKVLGLVDDRPGDSPFNAGGAWR